MTYFTTNYLCFLHYHCYNLQNPACTCVRSLHLLLYSLHLHVLYNIINFFSSVFALFITYFDNCWFQMCLRLKFILAHLNSCLMNSNLKQISVGKQFVLYLISWLDYVQNPSGAYLFFIKQKRPARTNRRNI